MIVLSKGRAAGRADGAVGGFFRQFAAERRVTLWTLAATPIVVAVLAYVGLVWTGSASLKLGVTTVPFTWPVAYGIRKAVANLWWCRQYRRLLARASIPAPSWWVMTKVHRQHRRNVRYVRKQWAAACEVNKIIGRAGMVPALHKVRPTVEGDLTTLVSPGQIAVKGGVGKISENAATIAETCGCNELLVRRTGVGHAVLTFLWTEPMERVIPVAELPVPDDRNLLPYGRRRDGSPAALIAGQSALISGMTGGGKSGITWSLLAGIIRSGIRCDVWASDAKGGVEMRCLADKIGGRPSPLQIVGYAPDVDGTVALIEQFEAAMKARAAATDSRRWTVKDADQYPLSLLVFDECVEVMRKLQTGDPSDKDRSQRLKQAYQRLETIASQGRALGFMVLYLTQVSDIQVLGVVRKMVPQRLSLKQATSTDTNMTLGDGAEAAGAVCSQIENRPGLGYSYDETRRGFELFRATWCDDDDIAHIAEGVLPVGMESRGGKGEPNRQCAVYRLFDRNRRLLYVGITVDIDARMAQHRESKWWWGEVDQKLTMITWHDDTAAARVVEEREIRTRWPAYNDQHNRANPIRQWQPATPPAEQWPLLDEAGPAVTQDNVTPIRPGRTVRTRAPRRKAG